MNTQWKLFIWVGTLLILTRNKIIGFFPFPGGTSNKVSSRHVWAVAKRTFVKKIHVIARIELITILTSLHFIPKMRVVACNNISRKLLYNTQFGISFVQLNWLKLKLNTWAYIFLDTFMWITKIASNYRKKAENKWKTKPIIVGCDDVAILLFLTSVKYCVQTQHMIGMGEYVSIMYACAVRCVKCELSEMSRNYVFDVMWNLEMENSNERTHSFQAQFINLKWRMR